jgi:RNA polymerase sigma-70 factor (ECF subfamily)
VVSASESDLVLRARDGEREAFGSLVRDHQEAVFNVCYRMLGDRPAAEDMAQETFVRAFQKLSLLDVSRPFGPWIRRLAVNVVLNQLARERPLMAPFDERRSGGEAADHGPPEAQALIADRSAAILEAIRTLPPHYRAVIELRHFQELSYREISDTLRIPLSDVKSRLFRARRLLMGALGTDVR